MGTSFKDIIQATQDHLRQRPADAGAVFAAVTRQVADLRSEAAIRDFRLTLDEPPALGGGDAGPNPVEVVLAALGACQEITYRLYAEALGIALNHVSVKLDGRLDLRGLLGVDDNVRPGFEEIRAVVEIDSPAGAEEIQRLKATVDRHCPVLDLLRNPTPIRLELVQNGGRRSVAA
jgi:putative redox protein